MAVRRTTDLQRALFQAMAGIHYERSVAVSACAKRLEPSGY
jgi:hypothetical protein